MFLKAVQWVRFYISTRQVWYNADLMVVRCLEKNHIKSKESIDMDSVCWLHEDSITENVSENVPVLLEIVKCESLGNSLE